MNLGPGAEACKERPEVDALPVASAVVGTRKVGPSLLRAIGRIPSGQARRTPYTQTSREMQTRLERSRGRPDRYNRFLRDPGNRERNDAASSRFRFSTSAK